MDCQRLYQALIARGRARGTFSGYGETHHVVPKAHGGSNDRSNLVCLTAREHYLAHKLLFRIHRDAATARAFRLMCDGLSAPRGRLYAEAKAAYAASMMGENNPAKRPEVRAKISAALAVSHAFTGKKRPEHSRKMSEQGRWAGENNPGFGGAQQLGRDNPAARAIRGEHPEYGTYVWTTGKEAAAMIGVSTAAISQAAKKQYNSRGWKLEYTA